MQVEHAVKIINLDENFETEMEKMKAEGWIPAPGFQAIAVYPVMRTDASKAMQQKTAGFGGVMGGHIDDSKVFIIQGGKKDEPAA